MHGMGRQKPGFASTGILALLLVLMSGCSNDSDGEEGRNVGEGHPVDLVLEDFTVEDLRWAVYPGFFAAIEPQAARPEVASAQEIVLDMAEAMAPFLNAERQTPEQTPIQYLSMRNAVALMTQVIYTNRVKNFEDGRTSISRAIDRGEPARYQNDRIQFVEGTGEDATAWNYILAWVHVAEAKGDDPAAEAGEEVVGQTIRNAVIRVILALNTPGSQITVFPAETFVASGPQTAPDARITSFTLPGAGEEVAEGEEEPVVPAASLNQSWLDREDLWTWTGPDPRSFGQYDNVRCAHLRVDFTVPMAYFYISENASRVGLDSTDPDNLDPATGTDAENPLCGADYAAEGGANGGPVLAWKLVPENETKRY